MRIAALILGILGGLFSALLGFKWISDANEYKTSINAAKEMGIDTTEITKLVNCGYCLQLTLVLGIVGGVLAMKGKGKIGGALMIVGGVLPLVFAVSSLLGTFLVIVGAVLAFLSKPKAAPVPAVQPA